MVWMVACSHGWCITVLLCVFLCAALPPFSLRRILHEGDLVKVCNDGRGRQKQYRFFLFSDQLVYASRKGSWRPWAAAQSGGEGVFIAHKTLPLRHMRVQFDPQVLTAAGYGTGFKARAREGGRSVVVVVVSL